MGTYREPQLPGLLTKFHQQAQGPPRKKNRNRQGSLGKGTPDAVQRNPARGQIAGDKFQAYSETAALASPSPSSFSSAASNSSMVSTHDATCLQPACLRNFPAFVNEPNDLRPHSFPSELFGGSPRKQLRCVEAEFFTFLESCPVTRREYHQHHTFFQSVNTQNSVWLLRRIRRCISSRSVHKTNSATFRFPLWRYGLLGQTVRASYDQSQRSLCETWGDTKEETGNGGSLPFVGTRVRDECYGRGSECYEPTKHEGCQPGRS